MNRVRLSSFTHHRPKGYVYMTDVSSDRAAVWISRSGLVLITSGNFRRLIKNNDELAFVLGHGLGHYVAGHHYERLSTFVAMTLIPSPILLSSPVTGLMSFLIIPASLLAWCACSIFWEQEADYIGLLLMTDAGFNPEGAVRYWTKRNKLLEQRWQYRSVSFLPPL